MLTMYCMFMVQRSIIFTGIATMIRNMIIMVRYRGTPICATIFLQTVFASTTGLTNAISFVINP